MSLLSFFLGMNPLTYLIQGGLFGLLIYYFARKDTSRFLLKIQSWADRFEAWHRSWKSYKEPRRFHVPNIGDYRLGSDEELYDDPSEVN